MAPIKLIQVKFRECDIALVQDFQCGSLPYQAMQADWIKTKSAGALQNKTKIWLYVTDDGHRQIVGYGSLGKAKWLLEPEPLTPREVTVPSIPNLAIQEHFWGKPDNVQKKDRFSYHIMRHLISEGKAYLERSPVLHPLLVLIVHPDNQPAKKVYVNCGFAISDKIYFDKTTQMNCQKMALPLAPRGIPQQLPNPV